MSIKLIITILCLTFFSSTNLFSQFGKNGLLSLSTGTSIVNQYAKVSNDLSVGQSYVVVNSITNLNTPNNLECGDLIMIYQSQGANMLTTNNSSYGTVSNYNSAGLYELKHVTAINGNTITLNSALTNSYSALGKSQVIKIPQYTHLKVNSLASISSNTWNGDFGGIVVIHAKDSIIINGIINNTGKGFRGGIARTSGYTYFGTQYVSASIVDGGEKGEGICGYQTDYDFLGGRYCRGAAANAGGGGTNHNAGGGGGANASNGGVYNGAGVMCNTCTGVSAWANDADYISNGNNLTSSSGGGKGGNSFANSPQNPLLTPPGNSSWGSDSWRNVAGRGGRPLTNINYSNRIYFGGGGGAGDANDNSGGHGARGGGIIILISPLIKGNGQIITNGDSASNSINIHADALGGGGGGGAIIINSNVISTNLSLISNGGKGGSMIKNDGSGYVIGTGGGGGGGYVSYPNTSSPTCIATGGATGKNYYPTIASFPENGGTNGNTGLIEAVANYTLIPEFNGVNSSIGISFLSSSSVCAGQSVVLTPSGATNYSVFPSNTIGNSFTLTPVSNTTYTIYGIGTCFNYTTVSVSVFPNSLLATTNQTVCSGQSITISASGAINYTWQPSGSNTSSIIVSPFINTTYTVGGTNSNGCIESKTITVSVIQNPTLVATTATICNGTMATLTVNGATNYTWNPSVISANTNYSNVVVSPSVTTNYTVIGTTGGILNCSAITTTTLVVIPIPTISLTSNTNTICNGSTLHLYATGANTYIWANSISTNSTINVSPTTTQVYTVTGISSNGCISNPATLSITVYSNPQLTLNANQTICIGDSVLLIVATNANSILWNTTQITNSITVAPTSSTYYSVIVSDNTCIAKDSVLITVLNAVNSDFSILAFDTCSRTIELNCNNNFGNNLWLFSDGETISNQCHVSHQFSSNGVFSISFISNTNSNCADTTSKKYTILNLINQSIEIPNVFTPNGDGTNDVFDLSKQFKCQQYEIEIFNRWGNSIFKSTNNSNWDGRTTSGKNISDGTYFYTIKTSSDVYKGFISLFR